MAITSPEVVQRIERWALGAAVLGILVISPDSLVIRLMDADAWSILSLRSAPTSLALFLITRSMNRRPLFDQFREVGVWGLLVALTMASANVLWVIAITHTATANALVMLAGVPLFAALFGWTLLRERLAGPTWVALVVVTIAVIVLAVGGRGAGRLLGDAAALGATLATALSLNLMRKARSQSMLPAMAASQLLVTFVAIVPTRPGSVQGGDVLLITVFAIFILAPALALFTLAPRLITAGEVGLLLPLETVLGSAWVWLWLGEAPSTRATVAGIVIIGTLIAHSIWSLQRTGASWGLRSSRLLWRISANMGGRLIGDPVLVVVFGVFLYGGWRTNRRYLDTCAAIARGIRLRYERAPMAACSRAVGSEDPGGARTIWAGGSTGGRSEWLEVARASCSIRRKNDRARIGAPRSDHARCIRPDWHICQLLRRDDSGVLGTAASAASGTTEIIDRTMRGVFTR